MDLPGSERIPVPGAIVGGPAQGSERIDVTLILRRRPDARKLPLLEEITRLPVASRTYLTREEFAKAYGAHPEDLEKVRVFARARGLEVVSESIGARTVHVAGPVRSLEAAFGVTLQRWIHAGGSYRGRTGPVRIPEELGGIVRGVLGLDDRIQARAHFRRHRTASASDVSYTPPQVAEAYDFPSGTDGAGQTIGLLELGGGYAAADLTAYFAALGIPVPSITNVPVDGATNSPTGNPDGPDGEVELDLEVAGSIAPGARLVAYFAPNTDQGFIDGLTQAIHDTTNRPSILSISWGGPESSWTAQARDALSGACEDASTMGITVLAASGDQGATDGASNGTLNVDFPASSPFVLGCGGTRLVLTGSKISSEVVWNELANGEGATGGGISDVFPLPSFQTSAKVPPSATGYAGRGVPDVAGNADPASGYIVRVDGSNTVIGGTSAVAPLWAALVARINQSIGVPVGYLDPPLYRTAGSIDLHDITSGNNDGYSAGPGWDPCTGWGSPDGTKLLAGLRGDATAPARATPSGTRS
jgi:kumamolisin